MGIFGYLKGMIALTILAFIWSTNNYAFTFTDEVTGVGMHGQIAASILAINLLFSVLLVGLFMSHWALKKENKFLKSQLESQED